MASVETVMCEDRRSDRRADLINFQSHHGGMRYYPIDREATCWEKLTFLGVAGCGTATESVIRCRLLGVVPEHDAGPSVSVQRFVAGVGVGCTAD